MERWGREEQASPQDPTIPVDPERTMAAPRFDAGSQARARPAVPLEPGDGWWRRPTTLAALALAAAMIGGGAGLAAYTYYRRGEAQPPAVQATQPSAPGQNAGGSQSQTRQPASQPTTQADRAADTQPTASPAAPTGQPAAAASADAELRASLAEWVAATNARDVGRQMRFYGPRVDAYYLSRGASREAVRAEKENTFARATSVAIAAADPQIELSPDGKTAVMRFRKDYSVEGAGAVRSGSVLQELRWRRTPDGWQISSERDLRILN